MLSGVSATRVNKVASQLWWTALNCTFLDVSYNTNIVPNASQAEATITLSTFTPVKNRPMNRRFRSPRSKQNASCMVDLWCSIDKMATLIREVSHGGPMLCGRVRLSVLAVIVCEKQVSDALIAHSTPEKSTKIPKHKKFAMIRRPAFWSKSWTCFRGLVAWDSCVENVFFSKSRLC